MTREEKKEAIYNLVTDYCNDNFISDLINADNGDHNDLAKAIFDIIFEEE